MREIRELDNVILTARMESYGLEEGDIGTVVLVHSDGEGYEVEFATLTGKTIAVATVPASMIRRARPLEIPHARTLVAA